MIDYKKLNDSIINATSVDDGFPNTEINTLPEQVKYITEYLKTLNISEMNDNLKQINEELKNIIDISTLTTQDEVYSVVEQGKHYIINTEFTEPDTQVAGNSTLLVMCVFKNSDYAELRSSLTDYMIYIDITAGSQNGIIGRLAEFSVAPAIYPHNAVNKEQLDLTEDRINKISAVVDKALTGNHIFILDQIIPDTVNGNTHRFTVPYSELGFIGTTQDETNDFGNSLVGERIDLFFNAIYSSDGSSVIVEADNIPIRSKPLDPLIPNPPNLVNLDIKGNALIVPTGAETVDIDNDNSVVNIRLDINPTFGTTLTDLELFEIKFEKVVSSTGTVDLTNYYDKETTNDLLVDKQDNVGLITVNDNGTIILASPNKLTSDDISGTRHIPVEPKDLIDVEYFNDNYTNNQPTNPLVSNSLGDSTQTEYIGKSYAGVQSYGDEATGAIYFAYGANDIQAYGQDGPGPTSIYMSENGIPNSLVLKQNTSGVMAWHRLSGSPLKAGVDTVRFYLGQIIQFNVEKIGSIFEDPTYFEKATDGTTFTYTSKLTILLSTVIDWEQL